MQTITVENVKVATTGTSDKGNWTLFAIKDTDGNEYTSFDKKLEHLPGGTVLEIEVEMKKGKANIKKYEVKNQPEATPVTGKDYTQMSKTDWERKDSVQRASIEGQTVLKVYAELLVGNVKPDPTLERVALKALKIIEGHLTEQLPKDAREPYRGETGETIEMATKQQIATLKKLIADGYGVKDLITKFGWKVKDTSELTYDQAERLIKEAPKPPEDDGLENIPF